MDFSIVRFIAAIWIIKQVLLFISACPLVCDCPCCPQIVSRAGWNAADATNRDTLPIWPAPFAVIHHTASDYCHNREQCSALVRQFQTQHMRDNGWADIGYNFLIGGDGLVYEGRGWHVQGAHAPGFNNQSMGIALIGNFVAALPTCAARRAAQQLIRCGSLSGQIEARYQVFGHRQAYATECPGNELFEDLKKWPGFVSAPRKIT